jgi:hypothetical protein
VWLLGDRELSWHVMADVFLVKAMAELKDVDVDVVDDGGC